jgi:hypothetical protein
MERDQLQHELNQLNQRTGSWHVHQGSMLYVAGALAVLLIASFFNKGVDLGVAGQTIVLVIILGCLVYYRERQRQDRIDWKRRRELEERLTRRD